MERLLDRLRSAYPSAIPDVDFLIYAKPRPEGGFDEEIVHWDADKLGAIDLDALAGVNLWPAGRLIAYAEDRRWQSETGGIVIGGVPIATDDRSKVMILGARVAAQADPDWTTVWHGTDGNAYPLNAPAMIAISNAVEAHVNGTFARFAQIKLDIEAGEITTAEAIEAAFAAT